MCLWKINSCLSRQKNTHRGRKIISRQKMFQCGSELKMEQCGMS